VRPSFSQEPQSSDNPVVELYKLFFCELVQVDLHDTSASGLPNHTRSVTTRRPLLEVSETSQGSAQRVLTAYPRHAVMRGNHRLTFAR
jgi:hypothetical protein